MTCFATLSCRAIVCIVTILCLLPAAPLHAAQRREPTRHHAALLPADTLATLTLPRPQALLRRYQGSLLQRDVIGLEPLLAWARLGGSPPEVIEDMRAFGRNELAPFVFGPEFARRFGHGVTLALLPLSARNLVKEPLVELRRSFVALVTPREILEDGLLEGLPRMDLRRVTVHGGVSVAEYVFDNSFSIYQARLGLSYGLARDPRAVERLVDFASGGALSLRTDPAWKAADGQWSRAEGEQGLARAVLDLEGLRALLDDVAGLVPGLPRLPGELGRASWYAAELTGDGAGLLRLAGQFQVRPRDLYRLHREMLKQHPAPFAPPAEAALALWSNAPQLLVQDILTPFTPLPPDNALLALLGERAALMISGRTVRTPLVTLPRISISVRSPDPEALLALLEPSVSDVLGPGDPLEGEDQREGWTWDLGLGPGNRVALERRGRNVCLALGTDALRGMTRAAAAWEEQSWNGKGAAMHGLGLRGGPLARHLRPVFAFLFEMVDQEDRPAVDLALRGLLSLLLQADRLDILLTVRQDGMFRQVVELRPPKEPPAPPASFLGPRQRDRARENHDGQGEERAQGQDDRNQEDDAPRPFVLPSLD